MMQGRGLRWASLVAAFALAACQSGTTTGPTTATTTPAASRPAPLFYSKAGSLYVSDPAGSPGRKLTDGPADAQPAPSPDLSHVAFVRKTSPDDYGGELWVLDLTGQRTAAGPARRLLDPATLPTGNGEPAGQAAWPQWSPTGAQVAFVGYSTERMLSGGLLLVAAADTGALAPAPQKLWADSGFAWAPDGGHIAWVNARSDVRAVDVNSLTVGGESTPVVSGTNAFSVTYSRDGSEILFANGDAAEMDPGEGAVSVRTGGIYSVDADTENGSSTGLFTKEGGYYNDVAALSSGAVAFTAEGLADGEAGPSKEIRVLDAGSSQPHTAIADVAAAAQGPAWGADDVVAYLEASAEGALVVTDLGSRNPTKIDTGVDSFAWAPRPGRPARTGPATTPATTSATATAAGGLPPMKHFRIGGDQYGPVEDCLVDGDAVTCTSTWDDPYQADTYTGSFTGTLSGLTMTGTRSTRQTGHDADDPNCRWESETTDPITFTFSPDGTVSSRQGPGRSQMTRSGSCSGTESQTTSVSESGASTWTVIE